MEREKMRRREGNNAIPPPSEQPYEAEESLKRRWPTSTKKNLIANI